MKILRKTISILIILMLFSCAASAESMEKPARNYSGDETEIYTAEDLLAVKNNPSGKYILMNDISLDGYEWEPLVFSGSFNGNGHRILNVHIGSFTEETRTVYDCNHKPYDSHFAGFFGICEGAEIEYLDIMNIDIDIPSTTECVFTGLLSGYFYDSWASGNNVCGRSFLSTSGHCFGSGGIAGYGGESTIFGCTVSASLSNNDEDVVYKDEQFMGGAYALGYIDLDSVNVNIDGYDSDHGFVHDGGLIGSYYKYDGDNSRGNVSNCHVEGKITFYEDNTNRRAYCSAYIGEVMNWSLDMNGNSEKFVRDEIYDYSLVLRPHYDCANLSMTENITEADYGVYGCTEHTCLNCGYSYCDNYRLCLVAPQSFELSVQPLDENVTEDGRYLEGANVRISFSFSPEDAYPKEVVLEAEYPDAIEIGEPVIEYEEGKPTVCYCDAVIKKASDNTVKARVNNECEASLKTDVLSASEYRQLKLDKFVGGYGLIIGGIAICVVAAVVMKSQNKHKPKH